MPLYNSFVKLLALIPIFVLKDVIKWAKFPRNRYLDGNFYYLCHQKGQRSVRHQETFLMGGTHDGGSRLSFQYWI